MERPDPEHDGKHSWYQYAVRLEMEMEYRNKFAEERFRETTLYKLGFEEGQEHCITLINKYLDVIYDDNEKPDYRWNKECHGVMGLLRWIAEVKAQPPSEKSGVSDE